MSVSTEGLDLVTFLTLVDTDARLIVILVTLSPTQWTHLTATKSLLSHCLVEISNQLIFSQFQLSFHQVISQLLNKRFEECLHIRNHLILKRLLHAADEIRIKHHSNILFEDEAHILRDDHVLVVYFDRHSLLPLLVNDQDEIPGKRFLTQHFELVLVRRVLANWDEKVRRENDVLSDDFVEEPLEVIGYSLFMDLDFLHKLLEAYLNLAGGHVFPLL